ncbi:MAG TPA: hypothetical protein P5320_04195 [Bacteroidales bacterium]|nr:hypothetical protein [Bacteroidales bacterium]HOM40871.1 hypothetical protein [Bacteroidales bacterium]HPP91823.1 hypothetical protein [Bacteroidales bacterium]HQK70712.1 hypothetical protein [Bacteroidales bacterium]HRR15902.1 hypothetical protein [Bacteroidales bacterium]
MSDSNKTNNNFPQNKPPVFLIFITVILSIAFIFLVISYFSQKNKMIEMETVLTHEKDSLANEIRKIMYGYDTLRSNNDSLNAQLARERERIRRLLSINASNVELIKKYRAEINTLREIMKSYIVQIDSLNTRNKLLAAENQDIRQKFSQVQKTNIELEKVKEELSTKVEIASVIQAKNIVAVALNKNRKETTRIDRLDKLRVCFTLRENPIATAGKKTVYMRIIRPDQLLITTSPDNLFDYGNTKMIYTESRSVDYINQDVDMCIYVDNTGDFIPGNYNGELYLEGNLIGTFTFMLTKR